MSSFGLDVLDLHPCIEQDSDRRGANAVARVCCAQSGGLTDGLHHIAEAVNPQRFVLVPRAFLCSFAPTLLEQPDAARVEL